MGGAVRLTPARKLSNFLPVKSASVATVQHDLKNILAQVAEGKTFQITRHGKPVAFLCASLPPASARRGPGKSAPRKRQNPAMGFLAGTVTRYGDLVRPLPDDWEANH
jgi:antitoxin (DNA-binding transcriptional repressor) of toxin-antitoxin stability system